jgi:hypothetical protein
VQAIRKGQQVHGIRAKMRWQWNRPPAPMNDARADFFDLHAGGQLSGLIDGIARQMIRTQGRAGWPRPRRPAYNRRQR